MKKMLTIGGALAILFVGIIVGAVYGSAKIASANSTTSTASNAPTNTYCTQFQQDLAKRLNVSTSTLQQAEVAAADDTLAQMVKDGKLTQTQANQIKSRLANGIPCNFMGKGGHGVGKGGRGGFGFGGPQLQQYMTAVESQVAQGLGISSSTLTSDLQNGQTLHQIASAHNVSDSKLESIIKSAVQSELKSAVSAGTITQTQANNISQQLNNSQFLSNIISHPLGHMHMGVRPGAPKGTGTPSTSSTPTTSVNS